MSYRVEVGPRARKEIKALPGYVRAAARKLIRSLGNQPRPAGATELRDMPAIYRLWVAGRWRIVYRIEDEDRRIQVLRIRRKEDIEYETLDPKSSEVHEPGPEHGYDSG
ncbi:MAG: type II toxin-antitoxin system RelE/ParE family toxin [bacterium]|nr:type II toxin-antitoxin system RelE/ParE family toxin [bacterium]